MNQGIFDSKKDTVVGSVIPANNPTPQEAAPELVKKMDFQDPFVLAARMKAETAKKAAMVTERQKAIEPDVDKLNKALSGEGKAQVELEKEFDDLEKITEEDLKYAEKMIFDGFVSRDYTHDKIKTLVVTVCSTSAADIDLIDEMMWEYFRKNEAADKSINLSESQVLTKRKMLTAALSYIGMNGVDFCQEKTSQLLVLKRGIQKMNELEMEGNIDQLKGLRDAVKKGLDKRAFMIKMLSTPLIDHINASKYKFDSKMYQIMSRESILPKS